MTTNKPMTAEQLDELMAVAVRMQRDTEADRNFPSANFAYAVQVAVLELRGTRAVASVLAAENAALKSAIQTHSESVHFCELCGKDDPCSTDDVCMALSETPNTDAYRAEVRAQARNEGINYAASRLAAAFNHGFVDKPLTEVCDVVRMILDTKEELANSTLPAADGLSGEYAEKFLEELAAQLRRRPNEQHQQTGAAPNRRESER